MIDMAAATDSVHVGAALQAMQCALTVVPETSQHACPNGGVTAWPAPGASLRSILEEVVEQLTDIGGLNVPNRHPPHIQNFCTSCLLCCLKSENRTRGSASSADFSSASYWIRTVNHTFLNYSFGGVQG